MPRQRLQARALRLRDPDSFRRRRCDGCPARSRLEVLRAGVDGRRPVLAHAGEVGVDRRGRGEPDEDRPIALRADAEAADDAPLDTPRARRARVVAVGDERIRVRRERARAGHQVAVPVALPLVVDERGGAARDRGEAGEDDERGGDGGSDAPAAPGAAVRRREAPRR